MSSGKRLIYRPAKSNSGLWNEIPIEKNAPMVGEKGYTRPNCIYCPQPRYSDEAFKEKIQGSVIVTAVIAPDGKAHNVHILKGLGHGLDQAAVKAVLGWQLKPANGPDGEPAAVHMMIEIEFHEYQQSAEKTLSRQKNARFMVFGNERGYCYDRS